MKRLISTLILAALTLMGGSAFIVKNSTGITGYCGSPGESTCNYCHGGGSSASSGLTITSVPAFSLDANQQLDYFPDSIYTISVQMEASGFSKYGFASEVLLDATNNNAGTMQTPGVGVKFLNSGLRRTATHTTIKNATGVATFTYKWTAPAAGNGNVTIYAIGNAVNGNGAYTGDFVIAPINQPLVEGTPPLPPPDTTGIKENSIGVSQVLVFPNPANDLTHISYSLKQSRLITVELVDIKGTLVRQLYRGEDEPGPHTQILNVQGVASGAYFIKVNAGGLKASQKLITIQ